jgi:hypothetical protein
MAQSNAQRKEDENTDAQPEESRGGRQPVDKFNDGPVQVSIFQNPSSKGDFRTANIQVRYKDKDGEFQTSHSYTAAVLKHLASASIEAAERISKWEEQNKSQQEGQSR